MSSLPPDRAKKGAGTGGAMPGKTPGEMAERSSSPPRPQPGVRESSAKALSSEDRHDRIAKAAYRRAEQRGFGPGAELDDWLAAEREVDSQQQRPGS